MRTIYKYPVQRNEQFFSMMVPKDFKFLRIAWQNERLFLWAEITKDSDPVEQKFALFGTGQDIKPGLTYLATYDDGPFVFHLYRF
jgi:hypothetical protein